MVAVPVRLAEERPFAELGEVRRQRRVEVRAADQLDAGPLGEQPAESTSLEGVGDARQVEAALLVEQPLAGLHVPLDPIDDPEQAGGRPAREERLAGEDPDSHRIHDGHAHCRRAEDLDHDESAGDRSQGSSRHPHRRRSDPELEPVAPPHRRPGPGRVKRIGVPARLEKVERSQPAGEVAPEEPGSAEAASAQPRTRSPRRAQEGPEARGQDQALDGCLAGHNLPQPCDDTLPEWRRQSRSSPWSTPARFPATTRRRSRQDDRRDEPDAQVPLGSKPVLAGRLVRMATITPHSPPARGPWAWSGEPDARRNEVGPRP